MHWLQCLYNYTWLIVPLPSLHVKLRQCCKHQYWQMVAYLFVYAFIYMYIYAQTILCIRPNGYLIYCMYEPRTCVRKKKSALTKILHMQVEGKISSSHLRAWVCVHTLLLWQVLSVPFEQVKLNQVDKAEAALLSLRRLLDQGGDPESKGMVALGSIHLLHDFVTGVEQSLWWVVGKKCRGSGGPLPGKFWESTLSRELFSKTSDSFPIHPFF